MPNYYYGQYCILYFKAAKRIELKRSHDEMKWSLCDVMDVLANSVMVIILQNMHAC